MGELFSRVFSVLKDSVILEKTCPFVKNLLRLFGKPALGTFAVLLQKGFEEYGVDEEDTDAKLTFLRSGYVLGRFLLSIENYDHDGWDVKEREVWPHKVWRVFEASGLEPSGNLKKCFVLLDVANERNAILCVAKALLLSRMQVKGRDGGREIASVKYTEVSSPHENVDRVLGLINLLWCTDHGIDHILGEGCFCPSELPLSAG